PAAPGGPATAGPVSNTAGYLVNPCASQAAHRPRRRSRQRHAAIGPGTSRCMPSGRPVLKQALRSALREIAVGQGKDGWRAGCKSRACGPGLAGIGPQRGADVLHEGQGRLWRGPQSEHPGLLIRWVAEAVPVPAGRYEHRARYRLLRLAVTDDQQPSAEHVDGLVELIMRVRDRPGARP